MQFRFQQLQAAQFDRHVLLAQGEILAARGQVERLAHVLADLGGHTEEGAAGIEVAAGDHDAGLIFQGLRQLGGHIADLLALFAQGIAGQDAFLDAAGDVLRAPVGQEGIEGGARGGRDAELLIDPGGNRLPGEAALGGLAEHQVALLIAERCVPGVGVALFVFAVGRHGYMPMVALRPFSVTVHTG